MNRDILSHASYQVGLKALIRNGNEVLILRHPRGLLDLPGGRINANEHEVPLLETLNRELIEELGADFKVKIENPLFQFRRHFQDRGYSVFITVYDAEFVSGKIELSSDHSDFFWVNTKEFKFDQKDFFHMEEYLAFKKYFESL